MESQHNDSDRAAGWKGLMAVIVFTAAAVTAGAAGAVYFWEHAAKPVMLTAASATHSQIDQASRPRH